MRVYSKQNVYEKALERIEWVFRHFKGKVVASHSGGKDSTSVFELSMEVVNKLKDEGFLPQDYKLKVMWLDQETEWTKTREHIERVTRRDDVEMYWMQIPFQLTHSASLDDVMMLNVYDPNFTGTYCQPLSPYAYDRLYVDENNKPIPISELNKHRKLVNDRWVYDKQFDYVEHDEKNFYVVFDDIYSWIGGGESYAILQGVKASESPRRRMQVTYQLGYLGITWSSSSGLNKELVRFSPIYDWSKTDNFVHFNRTGCDYNELYDEFLQFGISPGFMRVSSLIHETSVAHNTTIVQEIDRDLYNRMVDRLPGISTYSQLQEKAQQVVLPVGFMDYEDYARYLIENVMVDGNKQVFYSMFESKPYKKYSSDPDLKRRMDIGIIQSVLTKDVDKTKWKNLTVVIQNEEKRKLKYDM